MTFEEIKKLQQEWGPGNDAVRHLAGECVRYIDLIRKYADKDPNCYFCEYCIYYTDGEFDEQCTTWPNCIFELRDD